MILIFTFFALSVITLLVNILFYIYKRKKYYLNRIKILISGIIISTTLFLILNIPFFINNDFYLFIDKKNGFFFPTIIFNLANALYSVSIILFLLTFLQVDERIIDLEIPSQLNNKKGDIPIGRILKGRVQKQKFYLSIKDLEKHMFICGTTGTGKSNFIQSFLINFTKLYNIPFFLVEFKGEYHFLQKKIENVLILWPGVNFSINIFNPGKTNPTIHAERIFDILKSGQFLDETAEFSPQMEKVLVDILVKVCKNKNFQNWKGFEYFCKDYLDKNKDKIPMLSQTLISIKNRIRRFSIGPLKRLFENKNEIDIDYLFKNNILMDLSSIIRLGGEKEDALFFLNMILKYLWDKNLTRGAYNFNGIQHFTIIEDAQYFAPQDLMKKSKITTYLEDIALLQRGTGECLITLATRPDISKEILANNGVVLTFKNHIEKDIMCELLNIDNENRNFLSILEEGQCIIRVNSIKEPFLLKIPLIKHESLTIAEIKNKNQRILKNNADSCPSVSILKKNILQVYLTKIGVKISKLFSLKPKRKENNSSGVVDKHSQNNLLTKNTIPKKIIPQSSLNVKSYNKLETYIKHLYKLQKKKE